ncbi:IS66-like element accessory protein TnpA [Borborobacter arsenicus]|nr:transposase [Pseudaminobacter arsenicus]
MEDDDQKLRVRLVGRDGRRRYDPASKDRLVAACLEPDVSVSKLALEHGVNANLLRKWIKKRTETPSLPAASSPAFIPVQIESTYDRALLRQCSMVAMDVPGTCDGVRRSASSGAAPFSSPTKVSASLPNGVKLTLECGDMDALAAMIGALGHVQAGR